MWDKSEKHLAIGLLFANLSPHFDGFGGILVGSLAIVYLSLSGYHVFKEMKK